MDDPELLNDPWYDQTIAEEWARVSNKNMSRTIGEAWLMNFPSAIDSNSVCTYWTLKVAEDEYRFFSTQEKVDDHRVLRGLKRPANKIRSKFGQNIMRPGNTTKVISI